MTDEVNVPEEQSTPSLEELASEFKVEQNAPAQKTEQTHQPMAVPDMLTDPEGFAKWQSENLSALQQQISETNQKFQSLEQEKEYQRQVQDLQTAVDTINKDVDISKTLIRGFIRDVYDERPEFRKIFDNRHTNPNAYQKALGVLSAELNRDHAIKVDPQLVENQRAISQSQKAMSSGDLSDGDDWDNLSQAEFERKMRSLKSG